MAARTASDDNDRFGGFHDTAQLAKEICAKLLTDRKYTVLPEHIVARLRVSALKFGGIATRLVNTEPGERCKEDRLRLAEAVRNFGVEMNDAGFYDEAMGIQLLAITLLEVANELPDSPGPRGRGL